MVEQEEQKDISFLKQVVSSLVSFPDDIKITKSVDEMGVFLSLHVNPADMGRVIGREGRTAQAIRTLLSAVGYSNHSRISLKIVEPTV